MAEKYKVNTGVGMGMGETFQGTMGFVDPGENGIRDFNSVLKSLKEQNVSPKDEDFDKKLAQEMIKYESLTGAAREGTREFKETTIEKQRFRKDKKITTVKEEPYMDVNGEFRYLASSILRAGKTELAKNFGPEATSYGEEGVRYFKWAANNHNKNVENITKQALPEPYYNQVKEDARTAEEDAKRGIDGRVGSRYWSEVLNDFSTRREQIILQQNQTQQQQTQAETPTPQQSQVQVETPASVKKQEVKKDEVQETVETPQAAKEEVKQDGKPALEGMTQEEFNTYLDKLDKSFVEANGGIVAVRQQALTASGRQALDEKLKAFIENKNQQSTSQEAETAVKDENGKGTSFRTSEKNGKFLATGENGEVIEGENRDDLNAKLAKYYKQNTPEGKDPAVRFNLNENIKDPAKKQEVMESFARNFIMEGVGVSGDVPQNPEFWQQLKKDYLKDEKNNEEQWNKLVSKVPEEYRLTEQERSQKAKEAEGKAAENKEIDPKEAEQQKLASDFKKLYGVDYTPENIDKFINKEALAKAEKDLTAKGASKALKDYSTEDLAKLQFTVRQAEFDSKYKEEPDKAIADCRKNIIENKDNMNDAILDKMERYASGDEKIESPHKGKKARDLTKDEKKIRHQEFLNYKKEKDSFNMLQENAPEELQKHCKGTLEKANRKVNPKDTYSKKELAKAGKYARRTLKYKAMEIKDTDGLWSIAKKTAQMKAFTVSRSAQVGIKKWWKEGKVGKFARGLVDNKLTRGVSRLSSKVANKIKLFPSRAKKAIGKFWTNKIADPAKKAWQEKIVDPTKKAWQEKVVTPYIEPAKEGIKKGINWVKDNPKKVMAAAAMVATTGIGFALAGPAGGLAGAKIGAMAVGGAVLGYGAVKGAQWTYKKAVKGAQWAHDKGVEVKDKAVNNLKTNLRESFEQDKGKVPDPKSNEEKEKANADLAYITGRQVFNQVYNENPQGMDNLLKDFKAGVIKKDGNEGENIDDKVAAVKMYQTMIADKNNGGLGLSQESAQAVMMYFNGNKIVKTKFEDVKDEINKPVSQEKPKEEERKVETPTNESKGNENKGAEQTTPQPQQTQQVETPVAEPTAKTIPLNPEAKTAKAQVKEDFKQLKSNSQFGDVMAYCQIKYAQGEKRMADDASKKIEKMITADKDKGGLGLDPEKDADRIANLKTYLYKQGIKNDKFIKPKDNQQNREQGQNGKIVSMAAQKKQEELLNRA